MSTSFRCPSCGQLHTIIPTPFFVARGRIDFICPTTQAHLRLTLILHVESIPSFSAREVNEAEKSALLEDKEWLEQERDNFKRELLELEGEKADSDESS